MPEPSEHKHGEQISAIHEAILAYSAGFLDRRTNPESDITEDKLTEMLGLIVRSCHQTYAEMLAEEYARRYLEAKATQQPYFYPPTTTQEGNTP